MTDFMQYVWMQYPRPTNTTGVPVTISVLDPNNNTYQVATATSDANGFYSINFHSKCPRSIHSHHHFRRLQIILGINAETAINVENAPQATTQPIVENNTSAFDPYFVPAVVAIIVAIAIVGMVMVLMHRKRP